MKRRVVYFLFCLCFCFSTLSLSSSAVDNGYDYGFDFDSDTNVYYDPYSGQVMIYDAAGDYFYSVHEPSEFEPFELFRLSSPNYSDFDINKLPWLEMPTYIQDILYSKPEGLLKADEGSYTGDYKLPFVMVTVTSSYISIYAGYNLCIGAYFSSSSGVSNYALIAIKAHQKIYENSVCYKASYNRDYSLRESWSTYEPVAHGDNYVRYTYLSSSDASRDYYFYGSSGMYAGRTSQAQKIDSSDSDSYPQYRVVNDPISGFASGTIMYAPDNWGGYITSFTPPTAEQQQASTSKGIWETLKSIPDMIAEKIKGLFIPAEGYFDTYVDEYQEYFKDRFGFLYEVSDLFLSLLDLFKIPDTLVTKSDYSIRFPEVTLPYLDENGDWYEVVLIEDTEINFDFLEVGAFATLYELYVDLLWLIYIFALLSMIYRKAERFFGGTTE